MTLLRPFITSFWFIAVLLTMLRIVTLVTSNANLGPDESQYWFWSRDLAYGYFSKPPLIAWAIAATTAFFDNAEWAVRLSAPLFHFGAAIFLYLTARFLYDQRIGFWTGLAWLTLPGVILSSFLITTDAPLLFFWSGALYFFFKIAIGNEESTLNFTALGIMIGFGFLSKYAMLYFLAAFSIALLVDAEIRKKLLRPGLFFTGVITAILIAPNIWWNIENDFQTLSHTTANANWGAELFRPQKLFSFLFGQFAVAGVIPFLTLLFIVSRKKIVTPKPGHTKAGLALLIFALTPLIIVSTQALISRAHANWAATAYPAATLLITAFLFQNGKAWLAKTSVIFHAGLFLLFSIVITNLALIDRFGFSAAVKDIRGWEAQTQAIAAQSPGYDAIVIDDRALMGAMAYYQKDQPVETVAIDPNAHVDNHYEAFKAFDPIRHQRVLFVTTRDDAAHVDYRFKKINPLGPQETPLGNDLKRTYHLFDISEYYGR